MTVVVKIGTSSLTDDRAHIYVPAIEKLCGEVAGIRAAGHDVVIVTSGAITAGLPAMGFGAERPKDVITLQAASAVGQSRLLRVYDDALSRHHLVGGQILLTPNDFFERRQYLHARDTLRRLFQLGVIPIVNENDAIADEEIRFGDNDRIAALVAHVVSADLLVLLTDTVGVFDADPRFNAEASLISEIVEIDQVLSVAGGAGTTRGSGGMASKLAAARMASWSGIRTVIASSRQPDVLRDAVEGRVGVGTVVQPRGPKLSARKMWIAFALPAAGRIIVDDGARHALLVGGSSLLPAGIAGVEGHFESDSGVEIVDGDGSVFAKGLSRHSSSLLQTLRGNRTDVLPDGVSHEVVHRDDLVIVK